MRHLDEALAQWLQAERETRIGELLIRSTADGWDLRHAADANVPNLILHNSPEAARHLANYDAGGQFRPLKTAPTLIRGWRLLLPDIPAVHRALDYVYPAMLGLWFRFQEEQVHATVLRETLGRQTGMYRVTQDLTDAQAREMIDRFCAGCLKHRLWEIDAPRGEPPPHSTSEIPLLCHEACNLLVAEARRVVKASRSP
jgi:sirohydrochlorin cobaltochelatase